MNTALDGVNISNEHAPAQGYTLLIHDLVVGGLNLPKLARAVDHVLNVIREIGKYIHAVLYPNQSEGV
jgi:hypothetical protein